MAYGLKSSMKSEKHLYFFSLGILVFFSVTVVSLDRFGTNSRKAGHGCSLNDSQLVKLSVNYSDEAYKVWQQKGFKGRVVVALSRRLNFVNNGMENLIPPMSFPLKVFNLSKAIEGRLKSDNFLFVAMETGIAREIISVVPEKIYPEKREAAKGIEGVSVKEGRIKVPNLGSPREITVMPFFKATKEPALLYISASFFSDYEPGELLGLLKKAGIKTDLVILCRSLDDNDVTDKDREKLRVFEMLLGTTHG